MDRRAQRWIVMNIVRPPLLMLGFVLKPIGLLFGLLDRPIASRHEKQLRLDIAEAMPFLFSEHGGHSVPNEGVPFPPSFDYAFVTVAVDNLLIRFCRGRGELDLRVGSKTRSRDLHELGLVLGILDKGRSQASGYRESPPRCADSETAHGASQACPRRG